MRKLLFVMLFAVLATPAYAQQLASVQVTAVLRIPDFLTMQVGETTSVGTNARRVTIYVNANRPWQLSVARNCDEGCPAIRWRVIDGEQNGTAEAPRVLGKNGNQLPVVLEYEWDDGARAPEAADLQYLLTTG